MTNQQIEMALIRFIEQIKKRRNSEFYIEKEVLDKFKFSSFEKKFIRQYLVINNIKVLSRIKNDNVYTNFELSYLDEFIEKAFIPHNIYFQKDGSVKKCCIDYNAIKNLNLDNDENKYIECYLCTKGIVVINSPSTEIVKNTTKTI